MTEIQIGEVAEPAEVEPGRLIHLITAWNPMGQSQPLDVNLARQRDFESRLDLEERDWSRAAGVAEDGTWTEAGAAIRGVTRAQALAIARREEQEAIYEWDPLGRTIAVVSCVDDRVWVHRAVASRLSRRPCPMRPPADATPTPCEHPDGEHRRTMLWALGCDVCAAGQDA